MTRLVRRVAIRKIRPLSTRAQNPERPVQDFPQILSRTPAPILATPIHRQQRCDDLPLRIGEIQSDIPWRGASELRGFAETGAARVPQLQTMSQISEMASSLSSLLV
jgi:hypothetical protein